MPHLLRLKKKDFKYFKDKKSKNFSSECLSMRIYSTDGLPVRFSVVVPSSVSKKAVTRNKTKRRIKNAINETISKEKKDLALVIYAKKGSENKKYKELKKEISEIFQKAKINK